MHDIIGDIIDWDEAHKLYLAAEGATGERYNQRLEAAERMAGIEARWQKLPGGFHRQRKRIKAHIRFVANTEPSVSREELCWLAIDAALAWLPNPASMVDKSPVEARLRRQADPDAYPDDGSNDGGDSADDGGEGDDHAPLPQARPPAFFYRLIGGAGYRWRRVHW